jgi:hypothetical protein
MIPEHFASVFSVPSVAKYRFIFWLRQQNRWAADVGITCSIH